MPLYFKLSIFLNASLVAACVALIVHVYRSRYASTVAMSCIQDEMSKIRRHADDLSKEYSLLALSVAHSLNEIRQDIDRNYQHTHEGHILDRIADRIQSSQTNLEFDRFLVDDIRAANGAAYLSGDSMRLSLALDLAWHLHSEARRRAGEIYAITREECGATDRAAWLAKTLALYERICGGDKVAAITSLDRVLKGWEHMDLDTSTRQVR